MSRSLSGSKRLELVLVGLSAGGLALLYAWIVSGTRYMTTGIQFVAPLAIVILVQVAWLGARRELQPGFAGVVFARSLATAIMICGLTALSAVFAPMPVAAAADGTVGQILLILACLAVLALVVGAAALVVYGVALAAKAAYNAIKGRSDPPNKTESRFFDAGAVMLALVAIGTASLEGVDGRPFLPSPRSCQQHSHGCRDPSPSMGGGRQGDFARISASGDAQVDTAAGRSPCRRRCCTRGASSRSL